MRTLIAATVLAIALGAPSISPVKAATAQVVQIVLRDSSTDRTISGMQMRAQPSTVKAGRVTLEAVNQSSDLVHEVLVIPQPTERHDLPYDPKTNTIVERRAQSRGEISDLKPGAHGSKTLSLKPGTYLLVCNEPGHYRSGMYTKLVVER